MARWSWRAFVRQVLRRPLRIGLLVVLGVSVAVVVVGAQGWWIVLGVVLFQAAASGLVALWLESDTGDTQGTGDTEGTGDTDDREPADPRRSDDGRRPPAPPHPREPGPDVPGQREPDPDE